MPARSLGSVGRGLLGGLAADQIAKSNERAHQQGVAAGRSQGGR